MESESSLQSYVSAENHTNANYEFYQSVLNAPKLIVAPMVDGSDFWYVAFFHSIEAQAQRLAFVC
jgi:hypothetical protein